MAPAEEPEQTQDPDSPDVRSADKRSDDVRERMREALERKKARQHGTSAGGGGDDAKSHGGSGPARAQRTFRRKAGP